MDISRRSDRDVTYPGDLPETPDDAAHEAIYRDVDASILRDAINTLPKEMKEAIVMHYLMEQPVARIAKFLALPVSTVKWRIHSARVDLVQGPATFTIKQTINSTASTSGCYDDITLMPLAKEWTNEVVVVSQNPAVTGGMTPSPRVYVDPAAGWKASFRASALWVDPVTNTKYTCTGWKLYRNGALVGQKASLDCAYVHPAGADDRIVWGWKPWAPGDKLLGGGFALYVR